MKKLLVIALIAVTFAACNDEKKSETTVTTSDSTSLTNDAMKTDSSAMAPSTTTPAPVTTDTMNKSDKMTDKKMDTLKKM